MRLNRYIASLGISSRRKADEIIQNKRVRINGVITTDFSYAVSETDTLEIDGKPVKATPKISKVIAFHKPAGVVCSHHDKHAEKTIFELLPAEFRRYAIAGRLDENSRGLVLLSNDGDLVQKISHPNYQKEKEYIVTVRDEEDESRLSYLFTSGITDEGEVLRVKKMEKLERTVWRITLDYGKKRHIRRMFQSIGNHVYDLLRVRIGEISIFQPELPELQYRQLVLTEKENL